MTNTSPITLEAFAIMAAQRGLKMEHHMLERQYAGYCSLQELLAQLPPHPDPATDPALVFLGDASGISK